MPTPQERYLQAHNQDSPDRFLLLEPMQHGLLLGMTGTGKSTFARQILIVSALGTDSQLVLIDPKGDFDPPLLPFGEPPSAWRIWEEPPDRSTYYRLAILPEEAADYISDGHHVLFRPHPEHLDYKEMDQVFKAAYWSGRRTRLYIDEIALICPSPVQFSPYFRAVYQSGRGRQVTALGGSQRPSGIPLFTKSESSVAWVGRLRMEKDRQTAAEWMGYNILDPLGGDLHTFLHRRETDTTSTPIRLTIPAG